MGFIAPCRHLVEDFGKRSLYVCGQQAYKHSGTYPIPLAIFRREILKFYDAYICKLCLRPFYHSESGKIIMQVDEELKGQIHTEMMKAILKFEIRVK